MSVPGESSTTVHLLRHGEVHNPDGILYGRRDGFHLSDLGRRMARRVADSVADRDVTLVVSSPLERAQETAAPLASVRKLHVETDARLVESGNVFEGLRFGPGGGALRRPSTWVHLWNPFRPSWGEPYREVAARMMAAVHEARERAAGHEAVLVSHQLPIWVARLAAEKRWFVHDPRRRHCTLCSLTSLTFAGERLVSVAYSEPAGDLIPASERRANFSTGGAPAEHEPPAAS